MSRFPTDTGWTALDRVQALVEKISTSIAAVTLALLMVLLMVSTISRVVFLSAVPDADIIIGLMMVAIVALPLASAQALREHIVITIVSDNLSMRTQRRMVFFSDLISLAFFVLLTIAAFVEIPKIIGHHYAALLNIPMWPMRTAFAFAMLLFAIRLGMSAIASMRSLSVIDQ